MMCYTVTMITISRMKPTIAVQIAASALLKIEANFVLDLFSQSNSRIAEAQAVHRSAGKHFWLPGSCPLGTRHASSI